MPGASRPRSNLAAFSSTRTTTLASRMSCCGNSSDTAFCALKTSIRTLIGTLTASNEWSGWWRKSRVKAGLRLFQTDGRPQVGYAGRVTVVRYGERDGILQPVVPDAIGIVRGGRQRVFLRA